MRRDLLEKKLGSKCFPFSVDPFSEGRQNNLYSVAFQHENIPILF